MAPPQWPILGTNPGGNKSGQCGPGRIVRTCRAAPRSRGPPGEAFCRAGGRMSDLSAVRRVWRPLPRWGRRIAGASGRAVSGPASPFTLYCSQSVDWACRDPAVWVAGPGVTGYTPEEGEGQILRPPAEECCGLRAACGLTADRRRLAASLRARTCFLPSVAVGADAAYQTILQLRSTGRRRDLAAVRRAAGPRAAGLRRPF